VVRAELAKTDRLREQAEGLIEKAAH